MSLDELFDYFSWYYMYFLSLVQIEAFSWYINFLLLVSILLFLKESLDGNPALFCKKQPPVVDVANQYLELCKLHPTPIPNVKHRLNGFCGY